MTEPWLSVVMPTHNGAAYLPAALDSISTQEDRNIEILAVDDASTDNTVAILEAYATKLPMRIIRRPVRNWVANTNVGLLEARAAWVCFLHQDDLWLSSRLAQIRALMASHAEATLLLTATVFIDERGKTLNRWRCPLPPGTLLDANLVLERLLVQNFIAVPAPVFPRDTAIAVGGLDEDLWYTADWDFWLKIAGAGKAVYTNAPSAAMRVHESSQTIERSIGGAEFRKQHEYVLERHLPAWESAHPNRGAVRKVAEFSIDVNVALAATLHGQSGDRLKLMGDFVRLGPGGWHRYVRDSRIVERAGARVRGVHRLKSEPRDRRQRLRRR